MIETRIQFMKSAFLPLRICLACAMTMSLLCGCGPPAAGEKTAATAAPAQVSLVQLRRGDITRQVSLPGTITAYQAATLYAKVPGYLKRITVDKGDAVKEGQVLAELEAPELLAELPRYEAEVSVAEQNYRRLDEAQRKSPDLVTPLTVDEAKGALQVARANLKRIQDLLAYTSIAAPFSGIITRRFVDPGAFIPAATSGSAASTAAVVTLMDFSRLRIDVAVPQAEVPRISTAVAAVVTVEELPGLALTNAVTRFEYALDQTTRTMIAEIEMTNLDMELRPGMYAVVKLGVETRTNVVLAPVAAVLIDKSGAYVFTVDQSKAKKVPVRTGFNDGTEIEISSGADPGLSVILPRRQPLNNGQSVTVTETK